ncbi:MAG: hypothetical protein DME54_04080, partial [Verrucomicrobia bacterium]
MIRNLKLILTVTIFALSLAYSAWPQVGFSNLNEAWGPRYQPAPQVPSLTKHPFPHGAGPADRIRHWNEVAINASGLDHTPVVAGENRVFGEQFGPTRASRAMAIVHIAIFDAVNAINGRFQSYTGLRKVRADTSMECAIAQAACETLDALFPSQKTIFDQELANELSQTLNNHP